MRASAATFVRDQVAEAVAPAPGRWSTAPAFPADAVGSPYLAPQVLVDVDHRMRIMTEETFGPVVGIMPVDGDDEAVELMNDSAYGLTASIWTDDADAAVALGDRVETGTWYLNRCDYLDPALAWTGVKDSGRGVTLSALGFRAVTRPKSFHLQVGPMRTTTRVGVLECDHVAPRFVGTSAATSSTCCARCSPPMPPTPGSTSCPYDVVGGERPGAPDRVRRLAVPRVAPLGLRPATSGSPTWRPSSGRSTPPPSRSWACASATSCWPTRSAGRVERAATGWGAGVEHDRRRRRRAVDGPAAPRSSRCTSCTRTRSSSCRPGGEVLGHADHCPVALLSVGPAAMGVQAHPEFTRAYTDALLADRVARIGADEVAAARAGLAQPTDEATIARWMARVLTGRGWQAPTGGGAVGYGLRATAASSGVGRSLAVASPSGRQSGTATSPGSTQLETGEEGGHARAVAERRRVAGVHALVEPAADGGEVGAVDRLDGHVRDHDVAPGRQGVDETRHAPLRVVRVGHDVQDSDQQQADRPAQVQSRRRPGRARRRDGAGRPARRRRRPRGCRREGHGHGRARSASLSTYTTRAVGRELLGQLVGVGRIGDARADVEELAEPDLAGQEPHRPPEEGAVGAGIGAGAVEPARVGGEGVCGDLAVDGEMVRAAQQVVVDAGRVRHTRVDRHQVPVLRRRGR